MLPYVAPIHKYTAYKNIGPWDVIKDFNFQVNFIVTRFCIALVTKMVSSQYDRMNLPWMLKGSETFLVEDLRFYFESYVVGVCIVKCFYVLKPVGEFVVLVLILTVLSSFW